MAECWTPPDQPERERIVTDLGTSLLVEAGAGSGKTTSMVGRMVELVRTGTATMDQIAAVTFTRKAAGELRERFQEALEEHFRAAVKDGPVEERARLGDALAAMDRCFVGTIHAFCGRLLRERPLEAGVPPGFDEISGPEEDRFRAECWTRFLARLSARDSRLLARLRAYGLRPAQLTGAFRDLSASPDVRFPADGAPRPAPEEIARWRRRLERLLDDTLQLMPDEEPEKSWCPLQKLALNLQRERFFPGWDGEAAFLASLTHAVQTGHKPTYNRWLVEKEQVKEVEAKWDELTDEESPARELTERWLACRYPIVIRFARTAAREYARERLHSGQLDLQDLLLRTAALLRDRTEARRELGRRYRFLLVDEFQDTDPVQAEVVFLLAAEESHQGDWTTAVPRPGALFVVGDPKQSIYRFRRADIAVYNQVKERFRRFGAVLSLTANFRSTPPIEALVDRVFRQDGLLPEHETEHQAAFAPLRVNPEQIGGGIRWYSCPVDGRFSKERLADSDADLLASWIAGEMEHHDRKPGDFMILTRVKDGLAAYARAMERQGVPVQVTGSGVGMEEELGELVLLLRALADPSDGVLTVAVLEGLFFGLSHADLAEHARLGGRFDLSLASHPAGSPVTPALERMGRFARWARALPADAAVPRIVEELGILPHAVAGELGATRAGALLYALDALRTAGLRAECSLPEAVEVLETALQEEVDTPLVPGRTDVVRLMNLHKAKGLEAPVVVLAYPVKEKSHPPERHVRRDEQGRATGFFLVKDPTRRNSPVIARPAGWEAYAEEESRFAAAERARLLYVAATRAGQELVVARCPKTDDGSVWGAFHPVLDDPALATEMEMEHRDAPPRPEVAATVISLTERIARAERRRAELRRPSYHAASVTARVKGSLSIPAGEPARGARGAGWGRVVHQAMEAAGRGLLGHPLRLACRGFLLDEERETDDHGEPLELDELLALVDALQRSAVWRRARAAARILVEAPFAVAFPPGEPGGPSELVEGVVDLAFEEPDGWVIADYKTDAFATPEIRRERTALYRRQVELYARCWERLTGKPVKEKLLLFTTEGREESWVAEPTAHQAIP